MRSPWPRPQSHHVPYYAAVRGLRRVVHSSQQLAFSMATAPMKILVTGGTDGIGRETAIQLVDLGHNVTIAGRSQEKADALIDLCIDKYQRKVKFIKVDLSVMEQVKSFANRVADECYDIYIMNAGLMNPEKTATVDGLEMTIMTNLISTYIVVNTVLKNRPDEKKMHFVFMTSILIKFYSAIPIGKKLFDPTVVEQWEKAVIPSDKSGPGMYTISKIGTAMLAEWINSKSIPDVTATAIHPGCVHTNMLKTLPARQQFYLKMCSPFTTKLGQAGNNVVHAALHPLPLNEYYVTSRVEKLPSFMQDPSTMAAFSTFLEKYL
ncbi:unnamed protein product [Caenorhabditis bovis]|uniref:Uncharacterized protein n=1 Tax=Caenorhabditis bovis TaxID=2654633 RepID=A0A8S1F1J3_9PELO|nr:unnamed protein product [Caenorhabditis bovis]